MFNKKLYGEGLRQSFLFGLTLLILVTVINCFTPANMLVDYNIGKDIGDTIFSSTPVDISTKELYESLLEDYADSPEVISIINKQYNSNNKVTNIEVEDANMYMLMFIFIIPLVMIFAQFQFLNDRKACDFYHSIPFTRLAIAVNFSLSAFTWMFICVVIPMLCNGFIFSFIGDISFDYSLLIPNIIEKLVISFLVYSALLIGVSLSGQVVTCTVIAGLILFLPRYLITMLLNSINSNTQNMRNGNELLTTMIGNDLNLLVRKFTSVYDDWTVSYTLPPASLSGYVYTFILALILFAIGCYVFTKRPSEMTGKNTVNELLQHLVRIGLVVPLVIIATSFYYGLANSRHYSMILPISILIVILYFTFEAVTTKDGKKLVQSVAVFPVVILIAVGYSGVVNIASQSIISNSKVDINSIKSVSIDFNVGDTKHNPLHSMYDSYTLDLIKDYQLTNGKVIKAVSDALNGYISKFEAKNHYYDRGIKQAAITINTNSGNISRVIYFDYDAIKEILDIIIEDEHINTTLVTSLPEKSNLISGATTSLNSRYTKAEIQSIADVLYDEYNSLSSQQQQEVVYCTNSNYFSSNEALNNAWELNENLINELSSTNSIGDYKEYEFNEYSNIESEDKIGYGVVATQSSYNSNDLPLVLSLSTQNNSKYIYLNESLPKTKQLVIDMYISSNQDDYNLLNYFLIDDSNYFDNFNVTSVDDKFNLKTQLAIDQDNKTSYDELIKLLETSISNLDDIDYENMYMISFNPYFSKQRSEKHQFSTIRVLLPMTKSQFDEIA